MQDEELVLFNTCTDLVSLKRFEGFPLYLLGGRRPGEWICVREICRQIGMARDDLKPDLFVTWLPDPMGHEAYAVVLFFDDESKWTMAAHYNRQRLLRGSPSDQTRQPTGVADSASA
jgi:hypothetical protein